MTSPQKRLGSGAPSGSAKGWPWIPETPPPAMRPTDHPRSTHIQLTLDRLPSPTSASHPSTQTLSTTILESPCCPTHSPILFSSPQSPASGDCLCSLTHAIPLVKPSAFFLFFPQEMKVLIYFLSFFINFIGLSLYDKL